MKPAYNRRTWLNSRSSAFTGALICYDGKCIASDGEYDDWAFIELSDCHCKAKIHLGHNRDYKAFIRKVKKMRDELNKFLDHLRARDKANGGE